MRWPWSRPKEEAAPPEWDSCLKCGQVGAEWYPSVGTVRASFPRTWCPGCELHEGREALHRKCPRCGHVVALEPHDQRKPPLGPYTITKGETIPNVPRAGLGNPPSGPRLKTGPHA